MQKKKAIGQGIPLEEYEKQKQRLAELIEDYEEEEASELILKITGAERIFLIVISAILAQ